MLPPLLPTEQLVELLLGLQTTKRFLSFLLELAARRPEFLLVGECRSLFLLMEPARNGFSDVSRGPSIKRFSRCRLRVRLPAKLAPQL